MFNIFRHCQNYTIIAACAIMTIPISASADMSRVLTPPIFDYATKCKKNIRINKDTIDWSNWNGKTAIIPINDMYIRGLMYVEGSVDTIPNYPLARKIFTYLSEKSSIHRAESKFLLAKIYLSGEGVSQDSELAKNLFGEALANGEMKSAMSLGRLYEGEKNYRKAVHYYKIAASAKLPLAAISLALIYKKNLVTPPSPDTYKQILTYAQNMLLTKLAQGNCRAFAPIGAIYLEEKDLEGSEQVAAKWVEAASKTGSIKSIIRLAEMYQQGVGVKYDIKRTLDLWQEAASLGSKKAMYELGSSYITGVGQDIDINEGIKYLEKSAYRGNNNSMELLANIYSGSFGANPDQEKRFKWLNMAAKTTRTSGKTLYMLGELYEKGKGVKKNQSLAFKYYTKSASKNNRKAIIKLGEAYRYGIGVKQAPTKALRYYRLASSMGSNDAALEMVRTYECGIGKQINHTKALLWQNRALYRGSIKTLLDESKKLSSSNNSDDINESIRLLKKAVRLKSRKAMIYLGLAYLSGDIIKKDKKKADELFARAINIGDKQSEGLLTLADLYIKGEGLEKNNEKGIEYLKKALISKNSKENKALYFEVGKLYLRGRITKRDTDKGIEYLKKASELGSLNAMIVMAKFYAEKSDTFKESLYWYKRAAENGSMKAMLSLSEIYFKGKLTKKNNSNAKKWLEQAIKLYPCKTNDILYVAKLFWKGAAGDNQKNKAEYWLTKATSSNITDSKNMVALSEALMEGYGGTIKIDDGISWLLKSTKLNNGKAARKLGQIYMYGKYNQDINTEKAIAWFNKGAESGDTKAMLELSNAYLSGFGIKESHKEAIKWLIQAKKLGDREASTKLKNLKKSGFKL